MQLLIPSSIYHEDGFEISRTYKKLCENLSNGLKDEIYAHQKQSQTQNTVDELNSEVYFSLNKSHLSKN